MIIIFFFRRLWTHSISLILPFFFLLDIILQLCQISFHVIECVKIQNQIEDFVAKGDFVCRRGIGWFHLQVQLSDDAHSPGHLVRLHQRVDQQTDFEGV